MGGILIITNNDKVWNTYQEKCKCILLTTYLEVLEKVRDQVHEGGILLTHPMASSLKPNQTPYRSIILEVGERLPMDMMSLTMIEQALETYQKFVAHKKLPEYSEAVKEDFKTIDASLMKSAFVNWRGGL